MTLSRRLQIAGVSSVHCCFALWSGAGAADLDEQVWRDECSACHIAYPARFLPAASWKEIMSTLDDHFGAAASVDAATAEKISRYLASAARSRSRAKTGPPPLHITETRWFVHEHDEASTKQWRNPKVKSAANCGACHQDAEAGRFSERSLNIPKQSMMRARVTAACEYAFDSPLQVDQRVANLGGPMGTSVGPLTALAH